MRAKTALAYLSIVMLSAAGCASFSIEARGGTRSAPPPPPREHHHHARYAAPARLHIPPGHFPPPGECRIWHPGSPPGHQPRPGSCREAEYRVGPGDWLIYRPTNNREVVRVSFYDRREPRVRVAVRIYDYFTGEFVREM